MADDVRLLEDGSSQRTRRPPALDPVPIDERGHAEMLEYVRALAAVIPFVDESGRPDSNHPSWKPFVHRDDISVDEIVAWMKDPSRFTGDKARWLGRPHFALLLTFLELLGHARDQLNGISQRHLDHYYKEILGITPAPAVADRVAAVFRLASKVARHHLPAGTRVLAGRDDAGVQRIYRTERELSLSRARVDALRSVFVDRRITRLEDIRRDDKLDSKQRFDAMVSLALGPLAAALQETPLSWLDLPDEPSWSDVFRLARIGIDFPHDELGLEHHELRTLVRLADKTPTSTQERSEIFRLLEKVGRFRAGWPTWSFPDAEYATASFDDALRTVMNVGNPDPTWPWARNDIRLYEKRLRTLEGVLHAPVERVREVIPVVEKLCDGAKLPEGTAAITEAEWRALERLLADAHSEKVYAGRRGALRMSVEKEEGLARFWAAIGIVLGIEKPSASDLDLLARRGKLDPSHRALLDRFHDQLTDDKLARLVEWDDVYQILELAQRQIQGLAEPVVERVEWGDIYAFEDVRCRRSDASAPAWMPFGLRTAPAATDRVNPARIGFAISSPLLSMSQGTRKLTLMLRLAQELPKEADPSRWGFVYEVSTAKKWLTLTPTSELVQGDRKVIELTLSAAPADPPLAPLASGGDRWPILRVTLPGQQRPEGSSSFLGLLSSLELEALTLGVDTTSITLKPAGKDVPADGCLLHVCPFGMIPMAPEAAKPIPAGTKPIVPRVRLLPTYDHAGELYIGLRDIDPPSRLSLLLQLAEGTSRSDRDPGAIRWCVLDGNAWMPLEVRHDGTRGLVNSGIVELDLPAVAPGSLLPPDRYWLRVSIDRNIESVCDIIDIHPNAAMLAFEDRANSPVHYERPLEVGRLTRLLTTDARIACIEQPYTSFGGRPPEQLDRSDQFYTRVSERLRHKQRAITPWDYERLVLQEFRQIYKARCVPVGDNSNAVEIIVVPDVRRRTPASLRAPMVPADLLGEIERYLTAHAPPSAQVTVRNPSYVEVKIRLGVCFKDGWDIKHAEALLQQALIRHLSPWAFDDGAELTIGGKIYANSILDHVDRLEYVDYVTNIELEKGGKLIDVASPEYHVAAAANEVLVAAPEHHIDLIQQHEYAASMFVGIGYMKIEFDFQVG